MYNTETEKFKLSPLRLHKIIDERIASIPPETVLFIGVSLR